MAAGANKLWQRANKLAAGANKLSYLANKHFKRTTNF